MAGYVTKKLTRSDDARLDGRDPEFSRQSNGGGKSRGGGIGANAMWDVASEVLRYGLEASRCDVPGSLRHGRVQLPLGRYLRRKLREFSGKDVAAPVSERFEEQMRIVRAFAFVNSRSVASVFTELNSDYERALIGRAKVQRRRL